MWGQPQRYQPLPISTGNVGVDRCGNIAYYAAPKVVYARACWPCNQWPVAHQRWPWQSWGYGCGCGCGSASALASVMMGGARMANWMIAARKPTP